MVLFYTTWGSSLKPVIRDQIYLLIQKLLFLLLLIF